MRGTGEERYAGKMQWLDCVEKEEKITQHVQGTEID
jgi:hypothetical protein